MKIRWSFVFVCLLLAIATTAYAIPSTISYQGVLTDSGGVPLAGDYSVTFRLFDAATDGTQIWSETQDVSVSGGVYAVQLGSSVPFADIDFSSDYWLEVSVAGETLSPRQALTSVPYAIRAGEAGVAAGAVNLSNLSSAMCVDGEILVKTASGWTCGTLAISICYPGDFINCYEGSPGTMGVAACRAGVRVCNDSGSGYDSCVGAILPQAETCDEQDNDCNGIVDDNIPGTPVWYQDVDGDSFGDPATAMNFCPGQELAGYVNNGDDCSDSSYAVNPSFGERCDGTDSNCDGEVDNGCVTTLCTEAEINQVLQGDTGVSSECLNAGVTLVNCMMNNGCGELSAPDFDCVRTSCTTQWESAIGSVPPECNAGETRSCGSDVGACQTGIETCTENNTWSGLCDGEIAPVVEICDAIDNNCDGVTDNMDGPQWCLDTDGDGWVNDCIEQCEEPQEPNWIPYAEITGEGDCDDSSDGVYPGAPELCDGIDNDCDGETDEDVAGSGVSCSTGLLGICSTGLMVCDGSSIVCMPDADPQSETCDGMDNDCDGEVDEDLSAVPNDNQTGVCAGSLKTCGGINGWLEDYLSISNYEAVETNCDNLDNDCDGAVDEDLAGTGPLTTNQVGVCSGARQSCQDGTWFDQYVYVVDGYASEVTDNENCNDGLDNDCDGVTDSEDPGCQ